MKFKKPRKMEGDTVGNDKSMTGSLMISRVTMRYIDGSKLPIN